MFLIFKLDQSKGHLMWETQKIRVVKAGTLEKLVESLVTVKGELDSTYVNVFLATYRTFATPLQVLEILIKRCVSNDNILHYIKLWLASLNEDYKVVPEFLV